MKFKLLLLLLSLFMLFTSCKVGHDRINPTSTDEYNENVTPFTGKLNPEDLQQLRKVLSTELKTALNPDKAILINFWQNGIICPYNQFTKHDRARIIDNTISISGRLSAEGNAQDFFVYTNDANYVSNLKGRKRLIIDSGFFVKEIFTLNKNCTAFFIIKPNGLFIKYYGSDYFTNVEKFL